MSKVQITKTTKTYVSFSLICNDGSLKKATVRDWGTFNSAISVLNDKKDIKTVLDSCKGVLTAADYSAIKKHFFPTTKEVTTATKSRKAKETYFVQNAKQLDAMTDKMANHPGFLGKSVSRSELNSTVSKEVQKLYGVK
jgi:hypothetical protein